ncbi:thioredoxin TrxC [Flavimaricola sp.]|jgi:thioredoxin 2|nr:thioredoxin TrxC [Flavimaricola sp.]MDA9019569.1 thioredoxin TrxC [Flavimaricola sp.]
MTEAAKLTCLACGQINRVPLSRLNAGPKCATCKKPLMSGRVADLNPGVHDKATTRDELPIIVDYWAPWCGPCRMMAPEFAKAADKLQAKVRFAKIDTQDHPEISQKLAIRGIPLLILYAGGREIARLSGARPSAEIEAFIRQNIPAA